ncbi:SLAM family member 9-like [Myripristis murdjan]|uniref:SLAM family member 9-like n=1 Tax=Myripristis murdjan TaxID=586833 RepID=UPI0011763599|nr:SLAM family member 9-like [Myripristis murdjan]
MESRNHGQGFKRQNLISERLPVSSSEFAPGSSTVTSRFVLKGEDVTLDVQKPDIQEGTIFTWRFKREDNVVRLFNEKPFISPNYTGRVEFSLEDYSLLLKSLTEADSGVYSAVLSGYKEKKLTEYEVTVQERVSPVHLTVNSSSSDSCNFTVTCSSQNSSISSTLTCDGGNCSLEGGERSEVTASAASLRVYLLNGSVICNHSNQVSSSEDRKKIDGHCWLFAVDNGTELPKYVIIVIAVVCVVCPCLVGLAACHIYQNGITVTEQKTKADVHQTAGNI